jgi:insulysin
MREVENVQAEYSRNTNSDARKLLQLKRSLGLPPYSGFSTGSIDTLWKDPQAAGVSVPGVLQQLWSDCYCAASTAVAVVGPQEPEELLQHVRKAFAGMPAGSSGRINSNAPRQQPLGPDTSSSRAAGAALQGAGAGIVSTLSSSSSSSSGSEPEDEEGSAAAGDAAAAAWHAKAVQAPSEAGSELEACWDIAGGTAAGAAMAGQQQPAAAVAQPHPQAAAVGHHSTGRYPTDVFDPAASAGQLVLVCPQRDLREMQLLWYIPSGTAQHST